MNTKNNIRSMAVVLASTLILSGAMPLIAMADNPIPNTTGTFPSSVAVGSAGFNLAVYGNNFVPGSTVYFNGNARSTAYVSSTQLTGAILASDLDNVGTFNVTVINPGPGGGTSNAQIFTVGNLIPSTSSISPASKVAGSGSFTLTVYGANFLPNSIVRFNGSDRSTNYASSNQLTATINASDVTTPGAFNITVNNPGPGGGTSNGQTFIVTGSYPIPSLSSISPASKVAGEGSFVLTVYGSNFVPSSVVSFNGVAKATTFVSSGQLTAVIPASDIAMTGSEAVMVTNPIPGGGTSNAIIFTIDPISATPGSAIPGLPNTGFGPSEQSSGWTAVMAALAAMAGVAIVGMILGKRIWIKR